MKMSHSDTSITRRIGNRTLTAFAGVGLLLGAVSIGCGKNGGTTPQALTQASADAVVVGQDTKQNITANFGNATSVIPISPGQGAASGCVERWMYLRTYQVGKEMVADSMVVDFNASGIVCDRGYSQSRSPIP